MNTPAIDSSPASQLPFKTRIAQAANKSVAWIAVLWGWCIVMPVGAQYLCLFLLMVLMLMSGRSKDVVHLFRRHQFWAISVGSFVGITLLTLTTQDKYFRETPANLWHGIRIVLTLIVGLSLRAYEAKMALKAAVFSLCVMSLIVALQWLGLLQAAPSFLLKLIPHGNEWINMSILLAMLVIGCVLMPKTGQAWWTAWPLALACFALAMNLIVMNQRTAFLALIVGLVCAAFACWRSRLPYLLAATASIVIIGATSFQTIDAVNVKFTQGFREIEQAHTGVVSQASMNIRYHMYTKTTDMILERPWQGWGIGGWNEQWRQRAAPVIQNSNMPHNDFLWMGAQSGWPGALAWLALMLSLCWIGWQHKSAAGHIAFAVASMALISSLINSGTRDANIGLPMLYVVAACLAWARGSTGEAGSNPA
jgi:O-antigen ligase